jgi:integrase
MARTEIAVRICQRTEFIPNIPDDPMSRKKDEVTVSEPKLVGKIYYVTLHYRKPGSSKRSKTRYSTCETDKNKARKAGYDIRDSFRTKLYTEELSNSDKAPLGTCVHDYLSRNRFADSWERQVRAFLERFASPKHVHPDTAVCNVTRRHCEEFFHAQGGEHQPHTAFRVLRTFFNWLLDEGKLTVSPVTRRMGRELKPAKVIQDYFHEELREFASFFSKLPVGTYRERTFRNLFYLAQATGLRLQDVSSLEESEIDSEHSLIILQQQKTGESVRCYISPQVADAIALQQRNKALHKDKRVRESDYLFAMEYRDKAGQPFAPRTIEEAFLTSRRTILPNRPGLHFHSLRHAFGQNAYNYTGQHDEISVAMGHGSPIVTLAHYATNARHVETPERYARLRDYLRSRPVFSRVSSLELPTGVIPEREILEDISGIKNSTSGSELRYQDPLKT